MNKLFIIFATTIALTVSMISSPTFARGFGGFSSQGMERQTNSQGGGQQYRQRPGSDSGNQNLLKVASILNLTDEQITEIEAIQEAKKESAETIREETKSARESLRELLKSEVYDEAEVALLAEVIGDIVSQRVILESKSRFEISQVLTPEQISKMEELRNAFESRRGGKPEDTETLL